MVSPPALAAPSLCAVSLDHAIVAAPGLDPGKLPPEESISYQGHDFSSASAAVSSISAPRTFEQFPSPRLPGMTARTLNSGFRQAQATGLMACLKKMKLARCRERLLAVDPETKIVGDKAANWDFYHLGSFAGDHRKAFGELLSATLRQSRSGLA